MLVVAFCEIDHDVLGVFRKFSDLFRRRSGKSCEGRDHGFRRNDGAVLDHAAVLQHASTALQTKKYLKIVFAWKLIIFLFLFLFTDQIKAFTHPSTPLKYKTCIGINTWERWNADNILTLRHKIWSKSWTDYNSNTFTIVCYKLIFSQDEL